jgi:hypothetical protein
MEENRTKRPAAITFIGWCFIIIASVSIVSGIFSLGSFIWMNGVVKKTPEIIAELPAQYQLIFGLVDLIYIVTIIQILLSAFILIVCVQFLKLRTWARTGLEFINWFALGISTELSFFSVVLWILGKAGLLKKLTASAPTSMFGFPALLLIPVSWALVAVPLFYVNRFLRRKEIRELFV